MKDQISGTRWFELALVVAVAVLSNLQMKAHSNAKLDTNAWIEASLTGLGAALVYLRAPKATEPLAPSTDGLPEGVDATGPQDDIPAQVAEAAVKAALGPVGAAAPELAGNIVAELGRVLRRGIRL